MRIPRSMLTALCIAGATCAAAQTPDASQGLSGRDVREVVDLLERLRGGERLPETFRELRKLLDRGGSRLTAEDWDRALAAARDFTYERNAEERIPKIEAFEAQVSRIREEAFRVLPSIATLDYPNDDGGAIHVFWKNPPNAKGFRLERRDISREKDWEVIVNSPDKLKNLHKDERQIRGGRTYQYRVTSLSADGAELETLTSAEFTPRANWIHDRRYGLLIILATISLAVWGYIQLARRGVELRVRKIAGLQAVDDAVGRATEMGRPILFVPGIQDMNDIQTVAGLIVLGRVARTAAEHDAQLEVPTARSLVMTAARETVASAYLDAGRADAYDEKRIYYTTDEQFAYVATVTGTMVREKPATCFYMGSFFAESLILAETANTTGSIQIAGTAQPAQLPFFVAACDYTLIGEEFFAASAYLSGEPQQLGSLKGQDVGKVIGMVLLSLGVVLITAVGLWDAEFSVAGRALDFLRFWLLNTSAQ